MKSSQNTKEQITNSSWSFEPDPVHNWSYWEKVFTDEECDELIALGNSKSQKQAEVAGGKKDLKIRDTQIAWLYPGDGIEWAYERMTSVVSSLNERFFKFDLFGALEGFQFTKYEAPTGKYGKHLDVCCGKAVRKLSFTVQLSKPEDYEGGDLCLYFSSVATKMKKERGLVVLFPSYILHEVKPVTKGTRYSLVSWITGKPFK